VEINAHLLQLRAQPTRKKPIKIFALPLEHLLLKTIHIIIALINVQMGRFLMEIHVQMVQDLAIAAQTLKIDVQMAKHLITTVFVLMDTAQTEELLHTDLGNLPAIKFQTNKVLWQKHFKIDVESTRPSH
jgi:hypothetical protein